MKSQKEKDDEIIFRVLLLLWGKTPPI